MAQNDVWASRHGGLPLRRHSASGQVRQDPLLPRQILHAAGKGQGGDSRVGDL